MEFVKGDKVIVVGSEYQLPKGVDPGSWGIVSDAYPYACDVAFGDVTHRIYSEYLKLAYQRPDPERIKRIEKWATAAMSIYADATPSDCADVCFDYADAMEAEYQRRYFNREL